MNKCIGCGAILQSEDKNKPGYVTSSKLNEEDVLCQRCFRLKNYGEVSSVGLSSKDYLDIIHNIKENSLIIYVVDLFDFEGSFIPGINRILYNQDIILVANKIDLFPKSVNFNKLRNYVQHHAKELGVRALACEVISSLKGYRIDKVVDLINKYQNNRDVYIVGCTNVGKSSFVNSLLKMYNGVENVLTTSIYPGTTISTIEIPLNKNYLIDTPGIINEHQIGHYLPESIKTISPYKGIKPIIYQISAGTTLFIGGLVRIDLSRGEDVSFVVYKANALNVHKTKTEKAGLLYVNHVGEMLNPPTREEVDNLGNLVTHKFDLREKEDIVISGLGFVTVNKACKVEVVVSEKIKVFVREAII